MTSDPTAADLNDLTILVTGANSGIGLETARALAARGANLVLTCRSQERADRAVADIQAGVPSARLETRLLDLASLASIRAFAAELDRGHPTLDVLINNAGCFSMDRQETADGFELTYGVNHLGTFLLTNLLLPIVRRTPGARVVNVASAAHFHGKLELDDAHIRQDYKGFPAYAASKLANVAFSIELAQRIGADGPTVNAVHPGHVATNIWPGEGWFATVFSLINKVFATTPQRGAEPSVFVATAPELAGTTGLYFDKCTEKAPAERTLEAGFRRELWVRSAELVGLDES